MEPIEMGHTVLSVCPIFRFHAEFFRLCGEIVDVDKAFCYNVTIL